LNVLVVNAGSSSLKLTLLDGDEEIVAQKELPATGDEVDEAQLQDALSGPLGVEANAVGHRIVHGGERFASAVELNAKVEAQLRALSDLAPLHQRKSLMALDAVSAELRDLPAVACFDTAFHATMPEPARTYPLPQDWRERWAIRRYGFHGLSHAWVASRVPVLLGGVREGDAGRERGVREGDGGRERGVREGDAGRERGVREVGEPLRIVSCHLGAGASLCAISGGRSVDTTMGFTPLEGLAMATRSGSVDPGLLLWLMEHTGLRERDLAHALEHESGMLGLAGTPDMRQVLSGAESGDHSAKLALGVYLHRLRAGIAAMAAAMGGLHALAFTGGVGEASPHIRAMAAEGLRFLGVSIDERANAAAAPGEGDISADGASTRTVVLAAREDLTIAREVRALLAR